MVHRSDDEYNKLAFVKHQNGNRFLEFQTETNGARTTHGVPHGPGGLPGDERTSSWSSDGTRLTAHHSTNGETWTQLAGTAPLKTGAQVGLMAAGDLGTAPVAEVDWFRVTPDRGGPGVTADDEFDGAGLDGCRWAQSGPVRRGARLGRGRPPRGRRPSWATSTATTRCPAQLHPAGGARG